MEAQEVDKPLFSAHTLPLDYGPKTVWVRDPPELSVAELNANFVVRFQVCKNRREFGALHKY